MPHNQKTIPYHKSVGLSHIIQFSYVKYLIFQLNSKDYPMGIRLFHSPFTILNSYPQVRKMIKTNYYKPYSYLIKVNMQHYNMDLAMH